MYFSVIVTAYQVEPYLESCVESILAQNFEEFELILVDDGSPDNCPAICDAYGRKDKRVKVIHQKNQGVTAARKSGLKEASGDYVAFVDGDDRVMPEFLMRGYEKIEKTGAEMVVFSCIHEQEEEKEKSVRIVHEPVAEGLYQREDVREVIYPHLLMDDKMRHMTWYVSGKIIFRPLAERAFLIINEKISLGEDLLGIIRVYEEGKRVCLSREPLHRYRVRKRSGAHGFRIAHYRQISMVLEELRKRKESACGLPKDFDGQIMRYGAYMCFTLMIHAVNDRQWRQVSKIRRQMNSQPLKESVRKAQWGRISLKTRITYKLFQREMFLTSYLFLYCCNRIKKLYRKGNAKSEQ